MGDMIGAIDAHRTVGEINEPLDLVWGAAAIGAVINRTAKQTFHLLENEQLPARKTGGKWVASRRSLREHFEAGYDKKAG